MNTKLINTSTELPRKHPRSAFILFALACFALLPSIQAVVPAPDGGYPGGNTAEGQAALLSLTSGANNTAVGWLSLRTVTDGQLNTAIGAGTLFANTGNLNTATGAAALFSNTIGFDNTASGSLALFHNTIGNNNTANGASALFSNAEGGANTAIGDHALFSNITGDYNTAIGLQSLLSNTTGGGNTANGVNALFSNTTGSDNTATGNQALNRNTTGNDNTANGVNALFSNTEGNLNTASGYQALNRNTTGYYNTANGSNALFNNTTGFLNTANGYRALLNNTGAGNTALGYLAGSNLTNGDDNICIGNVGVAGDGGTIRIGESFIGATYIAGIFGQTSSGGTGVFINSAGKLGTTTSSRRFKDDIKPMNKASEALFSLKPVSFHYKKEIDSVGTSQLGLVAEDVEKVNPDLVVRDKEGKPYSVRYDQVNSMLLNEFLKEHRKNEEQQKQINVLTAQLKEQAAQIQKVNAQLEASKPAPQVVNNP
jgi:hypothetical protein